ncbi:MAG: DinB family protein [Alphaproteobacteria bacterium]|nr:DinB family protein [Alphaproteobacteria bacterium]
MMAEYFQMLGGFNRWANQRLYGACARLPEAQYLRPRKAFFSSIHGTLNHLLACDILWSDRLEGVASEIHALDQVIVADLAGLEARRKPEDERLIAIVGGLDDEALGGVLRYRSIDETEFETPLPALLGTIFNHQTHHRGQVHNMLSQAEIDPPPLDIVDYLDAPDRGVEERSPVAPDGAIG